jgi:hypothetical protein
VVTVSGAPRVLRVLRLFRLRDVPGRIRALTALVLVALTALVAVTGVGMADAREALRAIGADEGPLVVATSDVRNALSDMDAQVTGVLMTGREDGWLCDPEQLNGSSCAPEPARYLYDIRREDAQRTILQAAQLARGDPVRLRTVQAVLDGLQQYDRRVQTAMERGRRTDHAFGELPEDAAAEYRMATRLMNEELLPQAGNLTLDGSAIVESTHEQELSALRWGRARVIALGVAAIAALMLLQTYLAARFRRLVNPLLALATLGTVALVVGSASLLATEEVRLRVAQRDGFDPVLALSRAQSLGKGLDTDRTRALLDPESADRHDSAYLEKSQELFYIAGATDLESYYARLEQRLASRGDGGRRVDFGGFYGAQAREAATAEERRTVERWMANYLAYQRNDRRVRRLAEAGRRGEAARAHLDPALTHMPHPSFREHDGALDRGVGRHRYVLGRAVRAGQDALAWWTRALPVWTLVIGALVVAGVWPRLREYLGTPLAGTPDQAGEEDG